MEFKQHIIYDGMKRQNDAVALENLKILSRHFDGIDINWGPAFGTLIGIVRNDGFPFKQMVQKKKTKKDLRTYCGK